MSRRRSASASCMGRSPCERVMRPGDGTQATEAAPGGQAPGVVGRRRWDGTARFGADGIRAAPAAPAATGRPASAALPTPLRCRAADGRRSARPGSRPDAAVASRSPPAACRTRRTRRPSQRMALGRVMSSRHTWSAACIRLAACSACTTTASSSRSVPDSRAARQSGSRLKVVWLCGQYQRAIKTPAGLLRR